MSTQTIPIPVRTWVHYPENVAVLHIEGCLRGGPETHQVLALSPRSELEKPTRGRTAAVSAVSASLSRPALAGEQDSGVEPEDVLVADDGADLELHLLAVALQEDVEQDGEEERGQLSIQSLYCSVKPRSETFHVVSVRIYRGIATLAT